MSQNHSIRLRCSVLLLVMALLSTVGISAPLQVGTCAANQWHAAYFANLNLAGAPALTRCEAAAPNYDWGEASPAASLPVNAFSARWTGTPSFAGGSTTFTTVSDDGVRLFVDGVKVIDNWTFHAVVTNTVTLNLSAGTHTVVLEYFEGGGGATAKLSWAAASSSVVAITSFTANPATIAAGASSVLRWQTQNATSCRASGAWSGNKALNGSQSVTPTATAQYTLTCRNAAGQSATAQATVTVTTTAPPPAITSFTASPTSIVAGSSSTLSWQTQNATSCTSSGGWSGSKAVNGSQSVQPAATTAYTLTCQNTAGQTVSAQATVTVTPRPVITAFTVNPTSIAPGSTATLAWQTQNATGCTASGGWTGAKAVSGSQTVQPAVTTAYTLTCAAAGVSSAPVTVTVTVNTPNPLPQVTGLIATTTAGPRVNLTWNSAASSNKWVSGYYAGYFWDWLNGDVNAALNAVDMTTMTHFIFARYAPGGGTLSGSPGQLLEGAGTGHQFVENAFIAKAHAHNVKALLLVGGAGDGNGFDLSTANTSVRATFIQNILAKVAAKNYDGVDVDWEENLSTAAQQSQVLALLSELRAAAVNHPHFQAPHAPIIITWPAFWSNINYPTITPWHVQVAALVDQYNLMTYSMAGAWSGWRSWHHAPLSGAQPANPTAIDATVQEYVNAGVPRAKLGIGIGLYGIYYTPNVTGPRQDLGAARDQSSDWENHYRRLVEDGAFTQPNGTYHWDDVAKQSYYSYAPAWNRWGVQPITYLSYEDERSIAAKGDWVRQNDIGGTIVWTINYGEKPQGGNSMMMAVKQAFLGNSAVVGYRVYHNGALIATVATNAYQDTAVAPLTSYSYTVAAVDAAGNAGPLSAPVTVTTPAQ